MENIYTQEERDQIVEEARKEFFERVAELLPANDMPRIKAAYELAAEAHKAQIRKSGIPYITHPIAVARIALVELGLKTNPVMAALLHDVVEDTDYTEEDLRVRFGEDVAYLVGVLTKNSDGNYKESKQIDNFKHMLDSINYDIRALLIKLADRMHNMRTLGSMRTDKQMKITSETDYFYAPLANRLGLYEIKSELENLSLRWRSPQEYERIEKKIDRYMLQHAKDIEGFVNPIRELLNENGIVANVYARPRSVYALWRKMKNTGQTFKELEHVHQVNIVIKFDEESGVSEKNQCLSVYSTRAGDVAGGTVHRGAYLHRDDAAQLAAGMRGGPYRGRRELDPEVPRRAARRGREWRRGRIHGVGRLVVLQRRHHRLHADGQLGGAAQGLDGA